MININLRFQTEQPALLCKLYAKPEEHDIPASGCCSASEKGFELISDKYRGPSYGAA
jgi:hypothetical protein